MYGSVLKSTYGSIAYASQQPWIQNMSIKNNIIFGSIFQLQKYEYVIDSCALLEDFNSMPLYDDTEIG